MKKGYGLAGNKGANHYSLLEPQGSGGSVAISLLCEVIRTRQHGLHKGVLEDLIFGKLTKVYCLPPPRIPDLRQSSRRVNAVAGTPEPLLKETHKTKAGCHYIVGLLGEILQLIPETE